MNAQVNESGISAHGDKLPQATDRWNAAWHLICHSLSIAPQMPAAAIADTRQGGRGHLPDFSAHIRNKTFKKNLTTNGITMHSQTIRLFATHLDNTHSL
ncbi:hypothetical protein NBRC116601_18740 [Cognatishimia sp. WU-CL00825]